MAEVFFYHLQRQPLEAVLPNLLARSLERGWRVVVEAGSDERVAALDAHLWTFADDSFLPHGTSTDGFAAEHPIVLLTGPENPNAANVRFLVDGARPGDLEGLIRAVLLFDGNDEEAVARAREDWKAVKAAGHAPTYWQQTDDGRWEKRA